MEMRMVTFRHVLARCDKHY